MKKLTILILAAIIFLGLFVRLYRLSGIPPGLNRDEAALGYNAYSLLLTGKDEFGRTFPLNLESFGDWKLPGYSLLLMPLISAFGLSVFSVRFLSALAGTSSIFLVYLLTRRIGNLRFALLSAFLFSFLPWNLYFSRVAYEANVALTLVLAGTLFFFRGLAAPRNFLLSAIFFGASLFVYHSTQLFVPLFLAALIFFNFRSIASGKAAIIAAVTFLIFLTISAGSSFFGDRTKLAGISIFTDRVAIYNLVDLPRSRNAGLFGKLIYNKPLYFARELIVNHLNFYLPSFLVTRGGANPQHNLPGRGNLSALDYVLILVGLLLLLKSGWKAKFLLLAWLFLSPLASTITRDAPQYTRSVFAAGVLPIIEAFAVYFIAGRRSLSKVVLIVLPAAFFLSQINYLNDYFQQFPLSGRQTWNQPLISVARQAISVDAAKVAVSHPDYSPYMFILFDSHYDPAKFQAEAVRYPPTDEGFVHVRSFGRYSFPYTNDAVPTLHIIAP